MRPRSLALVTALVGALVALGSGCAGSAVGAADELGTTVPDCITEVEPDDVADAAPLAELPGCLTGRLPDGDSQDLWLWTIDDDDSHRLWTFTLQGVVGALTAVQLVPITSPPDAHPITYFGVTWHLDVRPDATGPATATGVLLPAGRFVLAIARTASAEGQPPADDTWRLEVASGPLPPPAGRRLTGAFETSGELASVPDPIRWRATTEDADRSWVLELRTPPGTGSVLRVATEDGTELTSMTTDTEGISRLSDLRIDGTVQVAPIGAGGAYVLRAFPSDAPDVDPEPNGTPATATRLEPSVAVAGRLADGDRLDLYDLTVDEALAAMLLDVRLVQPSGPRLALCVHESTPQLSAPMRCAQPGERGTVLTGLLLAPGRYLVGVSGDPSPLDRYRLRVDATTPPRPDYEAEPDDTPRTARSFHAGTAMHGWLDPGDVDVFRVRVGEPRGLWQVDVRGTELAVLELIGSDGTLRASGEVRDGGTSAILTDLYLVPGEHWLRVTGSGGYAMGLTWLGPRDEEREVEPNDAEDRAELLSVGGTRTGRLATRTDIDVYRLSLAATERLRFEVVPPPDGRLSFPLVRDAAVVAHVDAAGVGEPIVYDAWLPGGDYQLFLHPEVVSEGRYRLSITRLDPLEAVADREPNDIVGWAAPFPATGVASGSAVHAAADPDWYVLGPVGPGGRLEVRMAGPVIDVLLLDGTLPLPLARGPDGATLVAEGLVPGARPYLLVVTDREYTVSVGDPAPEPVAPVPGSLPVDIALELGASEVAGYWTTGQVVEGGLRVRGEDTPLELTVVTATSDARWSVEPIGDLRLEAGGELTVPVSIRIPEDAWAGVPVAITVGVHDGLGRRRSVMAQVTPTRDSPPVEPVPAWPIPEPLVGGLDAASAALGGVPVPSIDAVAEGLLHDGLAYGGGGMHIGIGPPPVSLAVDLAGDEPVQVAGTILTPLAGTSTYQGIPREIALELSLDGVTWQPALSGELEPLGMEQGFALASPVPARFARLRIDATWGGPAGELVLGEWKVVVQPGVEFGRGARDIADPALGGHVVWIRPQSGDPTFGTGLLSGDPVRQALTVDAGDRASWVVGFLHDRAARIERLEWVDPVGSDERTRLHRVRVAISTRGPLGPWQDLGTWSLRRGGDGSVTPLVLEGAPWARFLRFTATGGDAGIIEMPATLRVIELATGPDYRSALAEWDGHTPEGPMEWLAPPPPEASDDPDVPDDPAAALPIALDAPVDGRVHIGQDVDWYRVTVPAGRRGLWLTLAGSPTLRARLRLVDASGAPVPLRSAPGEVPGSTVYRAPVQPGADYLVVVEQAPVTAAVSFDTSGSLGPYLTWVPQALRAYALDLAAGQEWVGVRPFGESWLLEDWTDDGPTLADAAALYTPGWIIDPETDASALEDSALDALDRLAGRDGNRALLLAADAETTSFDRDQRMWEALERVGPSVFTLLEAGTGTPLQDRQRMQDLALAGAGPYHYVRVHSDVDRAFDRLATWLRRPAGYALEASASRETVAPPEPGSIEVVAGRREDGTPAAVPVARDVAIGIILDTSGSMRTRIGRRSRIEVAKGVLGRLVTDVLPPGVPVAVRVLGDRSSPCATRLAVPLGPLDPVTVTRRVTAIRVDQEADTPIGRALRAVAADLAGPARSRMVILITDSEETWPHRDLCGLDPEVALRELRASGIDARVNVVGLAVEDRDARRQLQRWARVGGGAYFDARDPEQLEAAIFAAAGAPYRVEDASGAVVATGTVGGPPVRVAPGTYRVVVQADPEIRFDQVVVGEGASVRLSVRDDPRDA
jgi:hypothetical protein